MTIYGITYAAPGAAPVLCDVATDGTLYGYYFSADAAARNAEVLNALHGDMWRVVPLPFAGLEGTP